MSLWLSNYHQHLQGKKRGGGKANLSGEANLIVGFTVGLFIKSSYLCHSVQRYLANMGLEKKKINIWAMLEFGD